MTASLGRARDLVAGLSARIRRRVSRRISRRRPDEHRLRRLVDWFDHAIELGASGIALGPIFASRTHGYDTTDHYRIDPRLGDDADFDYARRRGAPARPAHPARRRVQSRRHGLPAYRDAPTAATARWFRSAAARFDTFEGHSELITLNHDNPEVVDYTVDVMSHWLRRGADGWRLDAAYAVPQQFWAQVLPRVRERASGRVVRRRAHPRRLRRRSSTRRRFDSVDPVRAVEGDLEQPQRRQLLRAGLGAAAAQRVSGQSSRR